MADVASEAQRRATARYNKKNTVQKAVRFFPADADIAQWALSRGEPFATYVKRLIREDMERANSN